MHNPPEQEKIDIYLGELCFRLALMSHEARADARREASLHLDALIADFEKQGLDSANAVDAALRQFGDPVKIGREIRSAWLKKSQAIKIRKWIKPITTIVWFGCFCYISASIVRDLHLSLSSSALAVILGFLMGLVKDMVNWPDRRLYYGRPFAWSPRLGLRWIPSKIQTADGETVYYIKRLSNGVLLVFIQIGVILLSPVDLDTKQYLFQHFILVWIFIASIPIGEITTWKIMWRTRLTA